MLRSGVAPPTIARALPSRMLVTVPCVSHSTVPGSSSSQRTAPLAWLTSRWRARRAGPRPWGRRRLLLDTGAFGLAWPLLPRHGWRSCAGRVAFDGDQLARVRAGVAPGVPRAQGRAPGPLTAHQV